MKPDWLNLAATGDMTHEDLAADAASLRLDTAASNFLAAFRRTVEALERADMPKLAESLCASFSRVFRVQQ